MNTFTQRLTSINMFMALLEPIVKACKITSTSYNKLMPLPYTIFIPTSTSRARDLGLYNQLNQDGTVVSLIYLDLGNPVILKGTWKINTDKLTATYNSEEMGTPDVIENPSSSAGIDSPLGTFFKLEPPSVMEITLHNYNWTQYLSMLSNKNSNKNQGVLKFQQDVFIHNISSQSKREGKMVGMQGKLKEMLDLMRTL